MSTEDTDDYGQIAVGLGTVIAHKIAEVMPQVQNLLSTGVGGHGISANVVFRLGEPGEAPVVAALSFAQLTGEGQDFKLAPSPMSGQLALMPEPGAPTFPGANGSSLPGQTRPPAAMYPTHQQVPDQVPPPLLKPVGPPRNQMSLPDYGQTLTPPVASAMNQEFPYVGDPAAMGYSETPQGLADVTQQLQDMDPQKRAVLMQNFGAQAPAAPPASDEYDHNLTRSQQSQSVQQRMGPARLKRPGIAGEGDIS